MFVVFLVTSSEASAPTIPYQQEFILIQQESILIQRNNLVGYNNVFFEKKPLYRNDFKELVREKYPELADLLICMWGKESSYGTQMIGDKGMAYGHFQIWLSLHKDVTYNCSMDFLCSLNWTAKKVQEGKGRLWSTYSKCLNKNL